MITILSPVVKTILWTPLQNKKKQLQTLHTIEQEDHHATEYIYRENIYSHDFYPWKPKNGILGLLLAEMVRNMYFHNEYNLSDLCTTTDNI